MTGTMSHPDAGEIRAVLGVALEAAGIDPPMPLDDPDRWDAAQLARLSQLSGIPAEVHRGASDHGLTQLADALAPAQRLTRLHNLQKLATTARALQTLREASIDAAAFKGLAIAGATRADPMTRRSADIDILVPADQLVRLHLALTEAGAVLGPRYIEPRLGAADRAYRYLSQEIGYAFLGQALDVHWHLGYQRRSLPDTVAALARTEPVQVGGVELITLSPRDALIHAVAHWRYQRYGGLKYVVDILGLLRQVEAQDGLPESTMRGIRVARALASPGWVTSACPDGVRPRDWRMAMSSLPNRTRTNSPRYPRVATVWRHIETTPDWGDRVEIPLRSAAGPLVRKLRGAQTRSRLGRR